MIGAIAIMVLTFLMLFSFIQMEVGHKKIKAAKDAKSVELGKKIYNFALWKLAIVMIIKVNLENTMGVPKSMPILWFVDMIIMNGAVAMILYRTYQAIRRK